MFILKPNNERVPQARCEIVTEILAFAELIWSKAKLPTIEEIKWLKLRMLKAKNESQQRRRVIKYKLSKLVVTFF